MRSLLAITMSAVLLSSQSAFAQASHLVLPGSEYWKTLRQLGTVWVSIELRLDESSNRPISKETLQTDVEVKLRQSGVRVVDAPPMMGLLVVEVIQSLVAAARSDTSLAHVYVVTLELRQPVSLMRDPLLNVLAPTWRARSVVGRTTDDRFSSEVQDAVRDRVDEFINAYLTANPRR